MKKLPGFTLIELLISITIIGILSNIGLSTFTSSQMKGRDTKRKAYLKQVTEALESYYNDKGEYPADDGNGNMMGCGVDAEELCTWGTSAFSNTTPTTDTVYMIKLPTDPSVGNTFYYDGTRVSGKYTKYQLYARLENLKDSVINVDGSDNPLVFENVSCGSKECNYGVSSSNMLPTDNRTLATE